MSCSRYTNNCHFQPLLRQRKGYNAISHKHLSSYYVEMDNEQTATREDTYNIEFDFIPKKRGKYQKYVWTSICWIAAIFLLVFGLLGEEYVYSIDESQKNTTDCYKREKKTTASGIFTIGLIIFGVMVSKLFERLSLLIGERFQVRERYGGSCCEVKKATCYSPKFWGKIGLLLLISCAIYFPFIAKGTPAFELRYLVTIASGIGVGPLIVTLLNLNTESDVYISTLLEKRGLYVSDEIARVYYCKYLHDQLYKFNNIVSTHEYRDLSLKKLLLLITLDQIEDDLSKVDHEIVKLRDTEDDRISVYQLSVDENRKKVYAISCAKKPLEILRFIKSHSGVEPKKTTFVEEAKLFCRKLSDYLKPDDHRKCVLVPIAEQENLQNGCLSRCIVEVVYQSEQTGCVPGFIKLKTRHVTNYTRIEEDSHDNGSPSTSDVNLLGERRETNV